jgi:hypothetical protein
MCSDYNMGRNNIANIETRYDQDCPGIESRWGRKFLHSSTPAARPTQSPEKWVSVIFSGGKGAWLALTIHPI